MRVFPFLSALMHLSVRICVNQTPWTKRGCSSTLCPKQWFLIRLSCAKLKIISYTSNWLERTHDFPNFFWRKRRRMKCHNCAKKVMKESTETPTTRSGPHEQPQLVDCQPAQEGTVQKPSRRHTREGFTTDATKFSQEFWCPPHPTQPFCGSSLRTGDKVGFVFRLFVRTGQVHKHGKAETPQGDLGSWWRYISSSFFSSWTPPSLLHINKPPAQSDNVSEFSESCEEGWSKATIGGSVDVRVVRFEGLGTVGRPQPSSRVVGEGARRRRACWVGHRKPPGFRSWRWRSGRGSNSCGCETQNYYHHWIGGFGRSWWHNEGWTRPSKGTDATWWRRKEDGSSCSSILWLLFCKSARGSGVSRSQLEDRLRCFASGVVVPFDSKQKGPEPLQMEKEERSVELSVQSSWFHSVSCLPSLPQARWPRWQSWGLGCRSSVRLRHAAHWADSIKMIGDRHPEVAATILRAQDENGVSHSIEMCKGRRSAGRSRLWPIPFWPSWFDQFLANPILANPILANPILANPILANIFGVMVGPRRVGPGGPRRVGPRRVEAQNFALFFPSPVFFFFFPLFWSVKFWWCLERRGVKDGLGGGVKEKCHVEGFGGGGQGLDPPPPTVQRDFFSWHLRVDDLTIFEHLPFWFCIACPSQPGNLEMTHMILAAVICDVDDPCSVNIVCRSHRGVQLCQCTFDTEVPTPNSWGDPIFSFFHHCCLCIRNFHCWRHQICAPQ